LIYQKRLLEGYLTAKTAGELNRREWEKGRFAEALFYERCYYLKVEAFVITI
jgi:hypothetical protein